MPDESGVDLGECISVDYGNIHLPRKEVIHPQLPLRMPCYDFTLIIDPAVGPLLRKELRALPTLLV